MIPFTSTSSKDNKAGDDSVTTLQNDLQTNARFGVKFTKGDNLSGQIELGVEGSGNSVPGATGGNTVYTRLMFATYKFSGGSVMIGQNYTPWTMLTDQVFGSDDGNIGYGALYDSRQPQFKISSDTGLWIDFARNQNGALAGTTKVASGIWGSVTRTYSYNDDVQYNQIPKMGIGYDGKVGNSTFGVGFAYQTYKEQNDSLTEFSTYTSPDGLNTNVHDVHYAGFNFSDDVQSYLVYAHGTVAVGTAKVMGQIHYGQNLGNFGITGRPNAFATVNADGTGINNTDSWGALLQVSAPLTELVAVNVGAGYTEDQQHATFKDSGTTDYDQTTVYLNFPIKIAAGMQVVPEFDYFHYNNAGEKNPAVLASAGTNLLPNVENAYAIGAKWQIDF